MDAEVRLSLARESLLRMQGYLASLRLAHDELGKLIYDVERDQLKLENLIRDLEYEVQHGEANQGAV